jgi:spore coat polysaccharide biosynthesis predicted glycosyltransferase SpsG
MLSSALIDRRPRLAMRCDGGARIGAGHVARCLPLAEAFAQRGWSVVFVGRFDGLAAWLLERASKETAPPEDVRACGLDPAQWAAAIVDSYVLDTAQLCELARLLPVATLGEATRCDAAGILIDYHLDRIGERAGPRLLPGPTFAPLDPGFAGAGRAGDEVETVLVTVGGSEPALTHMEGLRRLVRRVFPEAEQLVPRTAGADVPPTRLLDLVHRVDLAVTAAGLTSYELACAGVPQVAVATVANQRRVGIALKRSGLADCIDLCAAEPLAAAEPALNRLRNLGTRRRQSELGQKIFDGSGADRAAQGLVERWRTVDPHAATIRSP